jgi:MYXO-CTERM domain-containing protein
VIRKSVSSLLILVPVLASACQGSGSDDSPKVVGPVKASTRTATGAPPAITGSRAAGVIDVAEVPGYSAYLASPPVAPVAPVARVPGPGIRSVDAAIAPVQKRMSREAPGVVASVDARRPVPTFVFAGRGLAKARSRQAASITRADQAALAYLDQYKAVYQLDSSSLGTAEIAGVHKARRGGQVIWLRQRVDQREVFGTRMSFLVDDDLDLVAIGGHIRPATGASWAASIDERAALARAVGDVTGAAVNASVLSEVERDDAAKAIRFSSAAGARFRLPQPARVREVFYALPKALVPAFAVSLEVAAPGSKNSRAYEYVIAADDGRILERQNRTHSEARTYNVWADSAEGGFRPIDGPHGDLTPHPTGDVKAPVEVVGTDSRSLIEIEGFNTNPDGAADPWLPDGAADLTLGNNVIAYGDHDELDGFSEGDVIAAQNGQGIFDFNYNFGGQPFPGLAPVRSGITQIFFVTNWLHDWWYDSGFNEAAGNAQLSNYGRGGLEQDPLLAEAQDTGGIERNNANMSTPLDGLAPRMQMYLFDGPIVGEIGATVFEITAPPELAGEYTVQGATFGVDDLVQTNGARPLTLVNDGVEAPETPETPPGTFTDGCEPFEGVNGDVAVVTRGTCAFELKAFNAEAAGAAALLVVNNDLEGPDALPPLGGSDRTIAIPVVGISFADGTAILKALGAGAVQADVTRAGRDRDPDRDGTIDNAIVAHEWGHFLHHRLTLCGTAQCGAMSEGWGDFIALHTLLRDGDDLHAVYGMAAWATNDAYFGIRRVPYSVELDRNALTFGHVSDEATLPVDQHPMQVFGVNSEVHNAGEIWATMLFEALVALTEDEPGLAFPEAQRRIGDYIVAGMTLAPPNPTFTDQTNAILAAIVATGDERDLQSVAQAFARRGFGTGAVSPPLESVNFVETEESFEVAGDLVLATGEVLPSEECDDDENLDGGESGRLVVTVVNYGPVALSESTVSVTDAPAEFSFPDGESATISELGPYEAAEVEIAVALDAAVEGAQHITLAVQAANDASFHPTVDGSLIQRFNFDDSQASSATDDVESKLTVWEPTTSDLGEDVGWRRFLEPENAMWYAEDIPVAGDQILTSPPLTVGDGPFVIKFDHRHSFEASDDGTGNIAFWDGGVVEYSIDGGETWEDVAAIADPGYGGTIFPEAGNPLADRPAFGGLSEGYLDGKFVSASVDLGTELAGEEVLVRFRLGTDLSVGDVGWDIDNIAFEGITNTPFTALVDDATACGDVDDGGDADPDDDDDDDGCGCRSTSGSSAPLSALLFVAALFPLLRRRRRK